jgi:O-antigen/teichoic acid export membrane protein
MARLTVASGNFLSQSFAVIVANLASAALSLAYVSLVSRKLGPAEYGTVTAAISLGNIFLLLLGPLTSALVKFSALYHRENDRARLAGLAFDSLRRLSLPVGAALALVLLASPLLQRALHIESLAVLFALALFAALSILAAFPRAVLSGEQRFGAFSANQVAEGMVRLVVGAAAVLIGLQAVGAMVAYAVGIAAAFALGLYQVRHLLREKRAPIDTRALFSFSVPVLYVYFYFVLVSNVDILVVKGTLPDTDAGFYGAASMLARLLFLVATPVYLVLFARVSALEATRDGRRLSMQVLAVLAGGLTVSYAVPWLIGEWVLGLLLGAAYLEAAPLLRILWITTSLLILQVAASHYLLAVQRLRPAWTFLVPCAVLGGLLWRFHASTIEVALCGLAAVASGFLVTSALVWIAPDDRGGANPNESESRMAPLDIAEITKN